VAVLTSNTSTTNNQNELKESNQMSNTTIARESIKSEAEINAQTVRETLAQFAAGHPAVDEGVARHEVPKHKISLPTDMSLAKGAKTLQEAATAAAETMVFNKTFKYRPWDGAAALQRVMLKYFGTSGRGIAINMGFFGSIPPQTIEIEIGYNETIQVPWGHIEFAHLEGTIMLGAAPDSEYGQLFRVSIECPKKFAAAVHGFFNLLEQELKENSIYKGKAIRGTDEPKFLPLHTDTSIVYNEDVYVQLDDAVWSNLRHTDLLRDDPESKIDPKVLLYGPYGTGKSECGRLTAVEAVKNGWTFISYNSGEGTQDDLKKTIQTARLLAPSVVFVEDVDIYAEDQGSHAQSRLLEMFDGISSKGHEVMIVMTSNKVDKLGKGMLRAGRIDDMIEIGPLNREAAEKLIRLVNKDQLADNIDFDAIYESVADYEPAFLRRTFVKARQRALIRTADELQRLDEFTVDRAHQFKLTTEDFVQAAQLLRKQHDLHRDASDTQKKVTFDQLLGETLVEALATKVQLHNDEMGDIDVQVLEPANQKSLNG